MLGTFLSKLFFRKLKVSDLKDSREIGKFGEDQATIFLKKSGYKVIERNWRHKRDEIDIVSRQGNILVFVEVKTRSSESYTRGYQAVDKNKKTALARACRAYLNGLSSKPHTYRVDVVEVTLNKNENDFELTHIENIGILDKT